MRGAPLGREVARDGGVQDGLPVADEARLRVSEGGFAGVEVGEERLDGVHDPPLLGERRQREPDGRQRLARKVVDGRPGEVLGQPAGRRLVLQEVQKPLGRDALARTCPVDGLLEGMGSSRRQIAARPGSPPSQITRSPFRTAYFSTSSASMRISPTSLRSNPCQRTLTFRR